MLGKTKVKTAIFLTLAGLPAFSAPAFALEMPAVETPAEQQLSVTAQAYVVVDASTGSIVISQNSDMPRVPASLTKLMTAMVFLENGPRLDKVITIQQSDQDDGACTTGGACLPTKPGVSYTALDLLHASLIASHNNATAALARSTGLSGEAFAAKMNKKASDLGLANTRFVEPTGINPANTITALEFSKVAMAAFADKNIREIAVKKSYSFKSANNPRYFHTVKNTDKLLDDPDIAVVGGKTGYLDESMYNFSAQLNDFLGHEFVVVVLGSRTYAASFAEAKKLAAQASALLTFGGTSGTVLGTSTDKSAVAPTGGLQAAVSFLSPPQGERWSNIIKLFKSI